MSAPWVGFLAVLAFFALTTLAAFAIKRTPEEQALEDQEQMEALARGPGYEEHA